MELLLNLIWVALAMGSFAVFMRRRQSTRDGTVDWRSLLTLACVLLLLFPVISASDDLHPTQALTEEATKRVQHVAFPQNFSTGNSAPQMLLVLVLGWLLALVKLQPLTVLESAPCRLDGHRISSDGRGPPARCN